jgi:hypothetical protein
MMTWRCHATSQQETEKWIGWDLRLWPYSVPRRKNSLPFLSHIAPISLLTDSSRPMRNGSTRCKLCDCIISSDSASLFRHQSGRRHRLNVASTGPQRSPPSQLTSNIQSAPPTNISPPVGVNICTYGSDPRVNVSGEDGLYFFVEGSGTSANPFFSFTNRNILIEKTNMSSCLSLQAVALTRPLGSWCELLWSLYS